MDAIDIATYATVLFLVLFLITLGYYGGLYAFRKYHKGYKMIWRWRYYNFTKEIEPIIETGSIYKDLTAPKRDAFFGQYSTIDDEAIWEIFNIIEKRFSKADDRTLMKVLLRFVQLNVDYVTDKAQYSSDEHYVLPFNTLARRKGDCEDSSFLFQSLIDCIGIDCISIRIEGHVTTGVSCDVMMPFTTTYEINGKFYKQAETTSVFPFGWVLGNHKVLYSSKLMTPTLDFKKSLVSDVKK